MATEKNIQISGFDNINITAKELYLTTDVKIVMPSDSQIILTYQDMKSESAELAINFTNKLKGIYNALLRMDNEIINCICELMKILDLNHYSNIVFIAGDIALLTLTNTSSTELSQPALYIMLNEIDILDKISKKIEEFDIRKFNSIGDKLDTVSEYKEKINALNNEINILKQKTEAIDKRNVGCGKLLAGSILFGVSFATVVYILFRK